jgi:putative DNA methylase
MTRFPKKLIEVALPLVAINEASAREKSIRHGHPSTLHLWWARRPLAAARAVIFSQMVDDPSEYVDVLLADSKKRRKAESVLKARRKVWEEARATAEKAKQAGIESQAPALEAEPVLREVIAELERERLFEIIRKLVVWENTTNEEVLQEARDEIWQSWRRTCAENADHPRAKELFDRHKLPAFHDPFAGGGALPLEAQRLGLEAYASDLNPVAVLINKAMIEIPPKFAGMPPVNPESRKKLDHSREWRGAQGLAEDVRYYGRWMRDEAEKRIGHLYPKIEVTAEMAEDRPDLQPYVGKSLTVIAWLWARTVKSPNPAFANVDVPLASTFMLSTKEGKEAYVEPVIEDGGYHFAVKVGEPKNLEAAKNGTKLARGANFQCLMSGTPIAGEYIKAQGKAGRLGARLMAIVADGNHGRVYLAPTVGYGTAVRKAEPKWRPEVMISGSTQYLGVKPYGMERFDQLFTDRQIEALTIFSDLIGEARQYIGRHALAAEFSDNLMPLRDGGKGAVAYAEAIAVYLAFALSKLADRGSTICTWFTERDSTRNTFARQSIQMTWDYAELNTLLDGTGSFVGAVDWTAESIEGVAAERASVFGEASQFDAQSQNLSSGKIVSTDPPYYDNVPYADLSDFFYIWLRRALQNVFPKLFATVAVPKAEELVAFAHRHECGKKGAEAFFLKGMTQAMHCLAEQIHPAFPVTVFYAYKQAETGTDDGISSTGWETFLDSMIRAGFATSGTWPIRTELGNRMRSMDSNALASSIVLVCRKRGADAPTATRREFIAALKAELPQALAHLKSGNIAPVDLEQAAIGPGMAVYTRYAKVLNTDGKPLPVQEALALINQTLDAALADEDGDFDADTRWALAWFEQSGFAEGDYGIAEMLSKAKNISVQGLVSSGILNSSRGKVRLLKPDELPAGWDPAADSRLTVWEIVHHLIRALESSGESAAAALAAKLGAKAEVGRELAYRLYMLCQRKKRATEALSYNALVQSWPEIMRLAHEAPQADGGQAGLFQ